MSKFVEVCLTINKFALVEHKFVLVEVKDESEASLKLAVEIAEGCYCDEIGKWEVVGVTDHEPDFPFDEVVYTEDYEDD